MAGGSTVSQQNVFYLKVRSYTWQVSSYHDLFHILPVYLFFVLFLDPSLSSSTWTVWLTSLSTAAFADFMFSVKKNVIWLWLRLFTFGNSSMLTLSLVSAACSAFNGMLHLLELQQVFCCESGYNVSSFQKLGSFYCLAVILLSNRCCTSFNFIDSTELICFAMPKTHI